MVPRWLDSEKIRWGEHPDLLRHQVLKFAVHQAPLQEVMRFILAVGQVNKTE